jgi:hypothetical protein
MTRTLLYLFLGAVWVAIGAWAIRWLREADDELEDEITAELERIGRTQPPYPLPHRPGRRRPGHLRVVDPAARHALDEDRPGPW